MKKAINKEKALKSLNEFKEFINKGNVVDLAVGVVIGTAFGKIVTSLVNNILMPLIGILIGGLDFSNLSIQIKNSTIQYGVFIQNILDFLIIAASVFVFIKLISKFTKKEEKIEEVVEEKKEEVVLLEEIRDLLKKKK